MDDLISRSALLEKSYCVGISDAQDNFYGSSEVVFIEAVKNAPAVDAVEVVRCEKCRHSEMIDAVRYCFKWGRNTENDGYCHEGY